MVRDERFLALQDEHGAGGDPLLQLNQGLHQRFRAMLELRKGRTQEDGNRFGGRLPALGPAVDVRTKHLRFLGDAEGLEVPDDLTRDARVALDEFDRLGAPAQRFKTDDARPGKQIEKGPARYLMLK